jgi:hypothetical protein
MMNRRLVKVVVALAAIFLMIGFGAAFAQQEGQQGKTIFDYKSDLKLTDDQVKKMRELLGDLDKEVKVYRAKLTLIDVDLQNLMEKEGDMSDLRKKIKEAYDIQASIKIADIETARKINQVLKPDQLKKWREIQQEAGAKK